MPYQVPMSRPAPGLPFHPLKFRLRRVRGEKGAVNKNRRASGYMKTAAAVPLKEKEGSETTNWPVKQQAFAHYLKVVGKHVSFNAAWAVNADIRCS